MDTVTPTMHHLFQQLGLPDGPADIDQFIAAHRPLPDDVRLIEAPFWNAAQSTFIRDQLRADDHWSVVIDTLNTRLRRTR